MLVRVLSVQFGAGLVRSLFDEVAPITIAWLRLVTSAVVLVVAVRPSVRGRSRLDWVVVPGYGVALGVMNWSIYQSYARTRSGSR